MNATWRQSVLAYLLLFGLTAGLVNGVFAPRYSAWLAIKQHNAQLRQAIDVHNAAHRQASERYAQVDQALKSLFESGELLAFDANRAAHDWQVAIKTVLRDAGVNLTSFTPRQEQLGLEAAVLRLELSFLAEPKTLRSILAGFTQVPGKARVELLSLRAATPPTSEDLAAVRLLEGRMVVSTLSANLTSAAPHELTSWLTPTTTPVSKSVPNRLTSLFDTTTRLKFLSPQVTHYRVAAITVTEQNRMAVVIDNHSGASYRVQVGDFIDAWVVRAIERDHIRVQAGDAITQIKLQNEP